MKAIRTLIVAELLAVAIPSATAHIWSESMAALATDFNEETPGTKAWTDDSCAEKKKQAAARLLYYVDALNRQLWDACYSETLDREYCAKYRKSIAAQRDWGLKLIGCLGMATFDKGCKDVPETDVVRLKTEYSHAAPQIAQDSHLIGGSSDTLGNMSGSGD